MQISEAHEGAVLVLSVEGRLDAATAAAFEERVLALIEGGNRRIVVDGGAITYISSAGLRVFLMAAKRLAPPSGGFAVGPLQPQVREVFDIAGFTSVLSIHDSRAAAVAAAS